MMRKGVVEKEIKGFHAKGVYLYLKNVSKVSQGLLVITIFKKKHFSARTLWKFEA